MRDYKVYVLSGKERLLCLGITAGLAGAVSWLFYHNGCAMALSLILYLPVERTLKRHLMKKRKGELLFQFKEILQMAVTALKAGYAMENAFEHAREEFVKIYHQVKLNVTWESLLEDLAERCGIEEISSFSQVFGFAKRSGGDFLGIFQNSAEKIRQKAEIKREIEVVIAAKRMEMNIMNFVPFGILAYVGITSPEFLEPLYGNWMGIGVMTVTLVVYVFACWLSEKIVDIQV